MRLALFQPDIPQNTGTLLRLGACLDLPIDIIEPCGFIFNEKAMKRAGMDYLNMASYGAIILGRIFWPAVLLIPKNTEESFC